LIGSIGANESFDGSADALYESTAEAHNFNRRNFNIQFEDATAILRRFGHPFFGPYGDNNKSQIVFLPQDREFWDSKLLFFKSKYGTDGLEEESGTQDSSITL